MIIDEDVNDNEESSPSDSSSESGATESEVPIVIPNKNIVFNAPFTVYD